ncbi:MAG: phosphotransferase [Chloroflexi bacterium]|nr:phosphotransferase [Chloroflexota bacterium]
MQRNEQDEQSDLWDQDWIAPGWSQLRRRLARTPEVRERLGRLLAAEPALAGRLAELAPAPIESAGSLFFSGRWRDTSGAGGAAGTAVLVKLNCTARDLFWMRALSVPSVPAEEADSAAVVPALFASGGSLSGEAVRWVVLERLPYRLNDFPDDVRWDMLAEAAARFQAAAARVPVPRADPPVLFRLDAAAILGFLNLGVGAGAPDSARRLLDRLDADWAWLERACPTAVNLGDLHPGNVLCRTPPPAPGRAVLIDPIVRVGPWAFDPAYCQANVGADADLVARTARWRERLGLPVGAPEDLARIATLLLGWMSAMWWPAPWLPGLPPRGTPKGAASVPWGEAWRAQAESYIEAAAAVGGDRR